MAEFFFHLHIVSSLPFSKGVSRRAIKNLLDVAIAQSMLHYSILHTCHGGGRGEGSSFQAIFYSGSGLTWLLLPAKFHVYLYSCLIYLERLPGTINI